MEVIIEHLGAVQFEIKARGHATVADQPRENGGFDEGMSPPELLLASLGSCAAFYAAQYLHKHELATEGTRGCVTAEKEKDPPRIARFRIEIAMPAELDELHRTGVEEAVYHCLIHNTLLHPPQIEFEFKSRAGTLIGQSSGRPRIPGSRRPKEPDSIPPDMSGCYLVIDLSPA